MGSSQSKKAAYKQQHQMEWSAERLQRESIVAAIEAYKRQRKLLIKQAKFKSTNHLTNQNNHYRSRNSLISSLDNTSMKGFSSKQKQKQQIINSPLYYSPNLDPLGNNSSSSPVPSTRRHYYPSSSSSRNNPQVFNEIANYPIVGAVYNSNDVVCCLSQDEFDGEVEVEEEENVVDDYYYYNNANNQYDEDYQNNFIDYNTKIINNNVNSNKRKENKQIRQRKVLRHRNRYNHNLSPLPGSAAVAASQKARYDLETPQFPPPTACSNSADSNSQLLFQEPHFIPESLYHLKKAKKNNPLLANSNSDNNNIKTTTNSSNSNSSNNNNNNNSSSSTNMHHTASINTNTNTISSSSSINNFYHQLHHQAKHQKGLAYNDDERKNLNLLGLLPAAKQDLSLQINGVINFILNCKDELSKYVYLRNLKDFNERLFYSALINNVELLMPLVYTPTVGLACQKYSEIYLKPRGLYITINDLNRIPLLLNNWPEKDVRVIVVTDGERILGLGDLGANGMGISIGKLSLYTALAGIPPHTVLPICLDVGTNNKFNLQDPYYIGLRHERIRGEKYDLLVEQFMKSVVNCWGRSCLIQFEDFANSTAFNLLKLYRDKYCTFNDDIQGTASVCLSGLISATKIIEKFHLSELKYLFYGAGEANLGTVNLLIMAMMEEDSISFDEALSKIWLVDSKGLIVSSRNDLTSHKRVYAQKVDKIPNLENLLDIIDFVKPQAIIGASAQAGAFNEKICKKMAEINERPIIFSLSNPTSKSECSALQAYEWTNGKCVFASGSPFDPIEFNGKTYVTGQGNNAYIFPAVGLAAIAAHVHTIPEDTFLIAARALSDQLTELDISVGLVYPKLNRIREVTLKVACRVLEHFYTERLATYRPEPDDKLNFLKSIQYDCRYYATTTS